MQRNTILEIRNPSTGSSRPGLHSQWKSPASSEENKAQEHSGILQTESLGARSNPHGLAWEWDIALVIRSVLITKHFHSNKMRPRGRSGKKTGSFLQEISKPIMFMFDWIIYPPLETQASLKKSSVWIQWVFHWTWGHLGHVLTIQFPPKLLLGPNVPETEIVEWQEDELKSLSRSPNFTSQYWQGLDQLQVKDELMSGEKKSFALAEGSFFVKLWNCRGL